MVTCGGKNKSCLFSLLSFFLLLLQHIIYDMPERVYIGNLHRDAIPSDLRRLFSPFGRILDLTVKTGFGFVEFESSRDADDAVYECHGAKICGQR
jgi:RNA recognition motif-containing protein